MSPLQRGLWVFRFIEETEVAKANLQTAMRDYDNSLAAYRQGSLTDIELAKAWETLDRALAMLRYSLQECRYAEGNEDDWWEEDEDWWPEGRKY